MDRKLTGSVNVFHTRKSDADFSLNLLPLSRFRRVLLHISTHRTLSTARLVYSMPRPLLLRTDGRGNRGCCSVTVARWQIGDLVDKHGKVL